MRADQLETISAVDKDFISSQRFLDGLNLTHQEVGLHGKISICSFHLLMICFLMVR